ncbi:BZ3500_MvSof-1268-A1-R1_Chr7-3g09665 [Microbotryum saponariae]|uniref:BZ3500_MvSof-1268-A1-R1_Chr7-3g09665 protein n=1 Tax=Microbotryum saponariae TaxID=289078 RepID=A0A2X0KUZ1_9BASI|nr:BZ3501_MvSof-1269-A2-R1_Chr7-2g09388 [Microbotryum saponariae]SDA02374.1 BZ3500_MvSof-1268-A1-R1_Chr7-3g09665 [Microbotryum saponariae]
MPDLPSEIIRLILAHSDETNYDDEFNPSFIDMPIHEPTTSVSIVWRLLPFEKIVSHCTALKSVTLNRYAMPSRKSWRVWHRSLDTHAAVASPIKSLSCSLPFTSEALQLFACLGSELQELVVRGWEDETIASAPDVEQELYHILRMNALLPSARTGVVTFGLRKISFVAEGFVSAAFIQSLPFMAPQLEELHIAEEVDIFEADDNNRGSDLTFRDLIASLPRTMKSFKIYATHDAHLDLGTFEGLDAHLPGLTQLGGRSHFFSQDILIALADHGNVSSLCIHSTRRVEETSALYDDEDDKRAVYRDETLDSRAAVQEMGAVVRDMMVHGMSWRQEDDHEKSGVIDRMMRLARGRAQRRDAAESA